MVDGWVAQQHDDLNRGPSIELRGLLLIPSEATLLEQGDPAAPLSAHKTERFCLSPGARRLCASPTTDGTSVSRPVLPLSTFGYLGWFFQVLGFIPRHSPLRQTTGHVFEVLTLDASRRGD